MAFVSNSSAVSCVGLGDVGFERRPEEREDLKWPAEEILFILSWLKTGPIRLLRGERTLPRVGSVPVVSIDCSKHN